MIARSFNIAPPLSIALVAFTVATFVQADEQRSHRLGDHPAIIVQRLQKNAQYDYASKFYPHPAWLRLYAEPPRDAAELASLAASAPRLKSAPAAASATATPASGSPAPKAVEVR